MNRTILGAILVLALVVLVSATTISVMTVKPARPTSVFVKRYSYSQSTNTEDMRKDIVRMSSSGWIIKAITTSGQGIGHQGLLVMEKY